VTKIKTFLNVGIKDVNRLISQSINQSINQVLFQTENVHSKYIGLMFTALSQSNPIQSNIRLMKS